MDEYEEMFKSICRLCLSQNISENLISLTDNSSTDGLSCFGKAVVIITNVSIKNGDKLPSMMCKICGLSLKQAINFKLQCEVNYKRLKRLSKKCADNHIAEENIKRNICDFVLFNQYFPLQTIITRSKRPKNRSNMKHKMSDRSTQKVGNLTEETYDFDDFIEHEESIDNCLNINVGNSGDLNSILHKKEDKIHPQPIFIQTNQDTKLNKKNCRTKTTDDANNMLDIMQQMIDLETYSLPVQKQEKITHKNIKKKRYSNKKNMLNTLELMNTHNITNDQENKLKSREIKYQSNNPKVRNLICKICHKVLANRLTFDHHMQRHNRCQYICDQCGKGFPVLAEMNMHQVARHGTGPYLQCDHCPYKAPRKLSLIEHLRIHTGERPFTCEKCGLTFRRRAIWRNHLVHHMEKKFQCMYCPRKFYRQAQVLAHCNNVHERKYMYICNICSITYTKTETVRRHMLVKHGIPRERQGRIVRIMSSTNNFPSVKEN